MDDLTRFEIWRKRLADAREAEEVRERQAKVRAHQEMRRDCGTCVCEDCVADRLRMIRLAAEAEAINTGETIARLNDMVGAHLGAVCD